MNNYHSQLTYVQSSIDMITYILERNGWDQCTFQYINWGYLETVTMHIKKSSKRECARYVKFMIGMQNTGRQNHCFTNKDKTVPATSNV